MESASFQNKRIAEHAVSQMISACEMIELWNKSVSSSEDYLCSPEGVQIMAASCMLIESIGEGVKKIERLIPGFLAVVSPVIPWKNIMGLRDHIAHGYFNLDADIIYDVAVNEIPLLKEEFYKIRESFYFS